MTKRKLMILLYFSLTALLSSPALALFGSSSKSNSVSSDPSFLNTLISFTDSSLGEYGCWYCPFFDALFDVMNLLATNVSQKTSGLFLVLMGIGILFFLAFKVGKMVVQLQEVDFAQFMTDVLKPIGRAIVAAVFLTYSLGIFYYLISPVLQFSLTLSSVLYETAGTNEMSVVKAVNKNAQGKVTLTVNCKTSAQAANSLSSSNTQAFSPGVKEALICNLKKVSASLITGIATGMYTTLYGMTAAKFSLPKPFLVLQGLVFVLVFFCIFIAYPLCLIDPLIKIAFVSALAPIWVVLWVFPATSSYTKKAWDIFFSACLTLFLLSIIVMFMLQILDTLSFSDAMWTNLFNNKIEAAFKNYPFGGFLLLNTMACGFLCFKMLGYANKLAQTFGGANLDLGVGNAMASTTALGLQTMGSGTMTLGRLGKIGAQKAGKIVASSVKTAGAKLNRWGALTEQAATTGTLSLSPSSNHTFNHTNSFMSHVTPETVTNTDNMNMYEKINGSRLVKRFTPFYNEGNTIDHFTIAFNKQGKAIGLKHLDDNHPGDYIQQNLDGTKEVRQGNQVTQYDKNGKVTAHWDNTLYETQDKEKKNAPLKKDAPHKKESEETLSTRIREIPDKEKAVMRVITEVGRLKNDRFEIVNQWEYTVPLNSKNRKKPAEGEVQ